MLQKTIKYNGATLLVKRHTLRDVLQRDRMVAKLPQDADPVTAYYFLRAMTQTAIDGMDFDVPTANSDPAVIAAALEAFERIDGDLAIAWINALDEVNAPLVDADTAPPEQLTEEDKTNPKSRRGG